MNFPGKINCQRARPRVLFPIFGSHAGFTLVEMIAAMAVALLLMGLILGMVSVMSKTWSHASETVSTYEKARAAFGTLTAALGQATCNSYWDYVDFRNNPRTAYETGGYSTVSTSFVPVSYKRNSELHFIAGPTTGVGNFGINAFTSANTFPGDAVFFQANTGRLGSSGYQTLSSSLNSIGFFVQFADDSGSWPTFTGQKPNYRYRLMEWLQPTSSNHIYDSTVGVTTWKIDWINNYFPNPTAPLALADNITLLVILPHLTLEDETAINGQAPASPGTLLCPNYCYDSRAWMAGNPSNITGQIGTTNRTDLMRNQLPPLVDIVMIAIDEQSVIRLQKQSAYSSVPPLPAPTGFTDSTKLEGDLQTYENSLSTSHINYRTFRSTVQIQSAKWSMPSY